MIKKRYQIEGMHCTGCTIAVEGAIEDVPGVKSVNADYARQTADVEFDEIKVTDADIAAAVELAGYSMALTSN